jgi:hypothetical protein
VVVGDAEVVDTSGDLDVVELAGLGVVVVLVATVSVVVVVVTGGVVVVTGGVVVVTGGVVVVTGGVVVVGAVVVVGTVVVAGSDVAVIVDGSADTVTVVGSAVMVTVDVSVGVVVTVTVDIDVEVTVPGYGTLNVAWTERLAVAEKLTLTDASVGFVGRASVVIAVVDSGAVAVPVPGSVESAGGRAVSVSVAVSVPATSPGTETSLGAADVVLVFVRPVRLRTVPWSKAPMVGWHELFAGTGGLESVRTMSVIPIAVVTNAAVTPARDICRRKRSACRPDHRRIRGRGGSALISCSGTGSSLLTTVCIELLLSPSRCADRWKPVTTLRTELLVKPATTPPSPPENKPEYRTLNSGSSAEHRSASSTVSPRRTARARHP